MIEGDLTKYGFRKIGDGIYQIKVNNRYVNCYKNPKGGGYWVCEIDPIGEPASNNKIATLEQLDDFIKTTCSSSVKSARVEVVEPKL